MFVVRIGHRGSVIWYGPTDVVVLPNANGEPEGLEPDVRRVLGRASLPLRNVSAAATLGVQPLKPGSESHSLEALLTLPDAELMHVDTPHERSAPVVKAARTRGQLPPTVLAR